MKAGRNLPKFFWTHNILLLLENSFSQGDCSAQGCRAPVLPWPCRQAGHFTSRGTIFSNNNNCIFLFCNESTLRPAARSDKTTCSKPSSTLHAAGEQPGCSSTTALAPTHIPSGRGRLKHEEGLIVSTLTNLLSNPARVGGGNGWGFEWEPDFNFPDGWVIKGWWEYEMGWSHPGQTLDSKFSPIYYLRGANSSQRP